VFIEQQMEKNAACGERTHSIWQWSI